MVICENVRRKIIPVASGKGGVGKSVIAANMSLALAQSGKSTVAMDLDLGGSNLHTLLGIKNTQAGIGNFLSGGSLKLQAKCSIQYIGGGQAQMQILGIRPYILCHTRDKGYYIMLCFLFYLFDSS